MRINFVTIVVSYDFSVLLCSLNVSFPLSSLTVCLPLMVNKVDHSAPWWSPSGVLRRSRSTVERTRCSDTLYCWNFSRLSVPIL